MKNGPFCPTLQSAFTLIELLVVIAIVGVLLTLLFPALGKAREKARQATCGSNLKQLHVATMVYLDEHRERFPKDTLWLTAIMPYMQMGQNPDARKLACPAATWPGFSPVTGDSSLHMTGYGTNPCLIQPCSLSRNWPSDKYAGLSKVTRDAQIVLYADAGQQHSGASPCMAQWWGEYMEVMYPGRTVEAMADQPVPDGDGGGIGQLGWMPEGETLLHFRHGGKAMAVFLDGHVQALEPGMLKQRNLHALVY